MGRRIATLPAGLSLPAVVPATAQAQDDIKLVVSPAVVKAGSGVQLTLDGCKTPTGATSPGFRSPAELDLHGGSTYGFTNVGDQPGRYTATFTCFNYPKPLTGQSTIKAPAPTPPAATPTTTSPAGKPKASVVKPKGAPQTGGGGTA